jgi:hypothetical protein
VRAAGWLTALCLLTALPLASYACVGGRSWRGVGLGCLALPKAVAPGVADTVRSPGWAVRGRVVAATGVGVLLVLVFGALFRAADRRFARLVEGWNDGLPPSTVARLVVGFAVAGALAAGVAHLVRYRSEPEPDDGPPPPRRPLTGAEWAVPLTMLVALFGTFVWTQVGTLFGGRRHVMDPAGPDFAVYARTGFVLLAVVTVLTLGVMAALARLADRTARHHRIMLRALGGVLCALTLVIVASALGRMNLYVEAYGFSGQRLFAYAVEAWLGLLFVLVLGAGWRLRAAWLARAVVATAAGVLLAVAAVDPEALMARTHIDRLEHGYQVDESYLAGLSADAAAEIDRLPEPLRSCVLDAQATALAGGDPWYRWNLGRQQARELFDRHRVRCGS